MQDRGGYRGSEVLVEHRHGTRFDITLKAGSHYVFIAVVKTLHKRCKLPKVIRTIGIAHQHIFAADEREGIDICPSQSTFQRFKDSRSPGERDFRGPVCGTVDDDD